MHDDYSLSGNWIYCTCYWYKCYWHQSGEPSNNLSTQNIIQCTPTWSCFQGARDSVFFQTGWAQRVQTFPLPPGQIKPLRPVLLVSRKSHSHSLSHNSHSCQFGNHVHFEMGEVVPYPRTLPRFIPASSGRFSYFWVYPLHCKVSYF